MSEKRITEESRYAGLALDEEELVARVAVSSTHLTRPTNRGV